MPDYIPGGDAEFGAWLTNFVAYANANLVALGLVAGDMTPVTNAQTMWNSAYPAHVTASQNAQSARQALDTPPAAKRPWAVGPRSMTAAASQGQAKDGARSGVETAVRPLVRRLQASPAVSDAERAALGITVPDPGGAPVGPPLTNDSG